VPQDLSVPQVRARSLRANLGELRGIQDPIGGVLVAPLVRPLHPSIRRQPLQLLSHLDHPVPRILVEFVPFSRKKEQLTRDI